ncbi:hypothetical protein SAMD00023353_2700450 [Rosellinia necatrix]|uniref:Uncharacterized protein n=1 Tax=Rosellinia necatrix TaxID=77044 RepID=A0A1W2TGX2_ROSNE|nr:hypothetical protein SAMD00023353_2700450 [Rosellinia necatrix]
MFTAIFTIDGVRYSFTGDLDSAMEYFSSFEATVHYTSAVQLTNQRGFDGKIGTRSISFGFRNGPTINGGLDEPISPAMTVSGSGAWSKE